MLFEVEFLQRRSIVIDTFDLKCAEALVERWLEENNQRRPGEMTVLSVAPVEQAKEAA